MVGLKSANPAVLTSVLFLVLDLCLFVSHPLAYLFLCRHYSIVSQNRPSSLAVSHIMNLPTYVSAAAAATVTSPAAPPAAMTWAVMTGVPLV